ncbi:MAG: hypothetical protein K2J33_00165 [Alistipes sp.]|nr:hypothetical protein [Alistipes sp.]
MEQMSFIVSCGIMGLLFVACLNLVLSTAMAPVLLLFLMSCVFLRLVVWLILIFDSLAVLAFHVEHAAYILSPVDVMPCRMERNVLRCCVKGAESHIEIRICRFGFFAALHFIDFSLFLFLFLALYSPVAYVRTSAIGYDGLESVSFRTIAGVRTVGENYTSLWDNVVELSCDEHLSGVGMSGVNPWFYPSRPDSNFAML